MPLQGPVSVRVVLEGVDGQMSHHHIVTGTAGRDQRGAAIHDTDIPPVAVTPQFLQVVAVLLLAFFLSTISTSKIVQ